MERDRTCLLYTSALISEKLDKQSEIISETFKKQNEIFREQREGFDKLNKKIDSDHEEIMQHMNEQFTLLRTELREETNTWKAEGSEVQEKQEEEVNKSYEDVRKVRDIDNAVNFTDVSTNKKLSTVGSNANVISKPRKKWIKKRNDFVSRLSLIHI